MILLVARTGPPPCVGMRVLLLDIDDIDVEDAELKAVLPDN
jgi:hypothetical protein